MRYFIAITRLLIFFLVTTFLYGFYLLTLIFIKHNDERGFKLRRIFLNIINPVLGFKIEKDIRISKEPALYVSNHRGLLDFFVVLRYVNAFVVSKAEVQNIPIFAPAAARTGVIFVKRENKKSRGATRKAIIDTILTKGNVLVFPEGTTNTLQTTMEFRPGTFEEAAKNGFPVVPIAIEYKTERDLWKEGSTWSMFVSQFGKWRTHCKLRFGDPLYSDDPKVLLTTTRQWIDEQMLDIQKDWSKVEF